MPSTQTHLIPGQSSLRNTGLDSLWDWERRGQENPGAGKVINDCQDDDRVQLVPKTKGAIMKRYREIRLSPEDFRHTQPQVSRRRFPLA